MCSRKMGRPLESVQAISTRFDEKFGGFWCKKTYPEVIVSGRPYFVSVSEHVTHEARAKVTSLVRLLV